MKNHSVLIYETWLNPIVNLIEEGEFVEAYALASYFPSTRSRHLIQLAALIGQSKIAQASNCLQGIKCEYQSLESEFANIFGQIDLNLIDIGSQAISNQYYELGDFCFDSQILAHPETSLLVADKLFQFTVKMIVVENFDRSEAYLERALKLNNSPISFIWRVKIPLMINKIEVIYIYCLEIIRDRLEFIPAPLAIAIIFVVLAILAMTLAYMTPILFTIGLLIFFIIYLLKFTFVYASRSGSAIKMGRTQFNIGEEYEELENITIERNTRIEFPSECSIEKRVELKIQLTREVQKDTRVKEKIAIPIDLDAKEAKLNVNITAGKGFAISPQHSQEMNISVDGDSNEVIFSLFPVQEGTQIIEIEFFKEATRIGYVIVETYVHSYIKRRNPNFMPIGNPVNGQILSMESPVNGLNKLSTMKINPNKHTLHVNWIDGESKLLYTIYPANRLGQWEKTIPNIQKQIEDDLRNLNAFLTEVVQQGNPSDERWDSICFNLQSVGANLFEMLIPLEVANQIKTWEIGSPIIISTNEQWIPWELMYDGEDFLGKKFIVARYPRISDGKDIPDKSRSENKCEREINRIVNVVGGDVPNAEADRATHLFSNFLPMESVHLLSKQSISALVKALPSTDILHFTCHGHLEPHLLQIAGDKNKSRIDNLMPDSIKGLPLKIGSLVFANACASTVPVLTFGKFSSFGWKFYQQGAEVFIGTLGAVPVKYAVNFAESVYSELFKPDEQITIGQAVARAKDFAANDRNLFWLLYCIYGDPDFVIAQKKYLEDENSDD